MKYIVADPQNIPARQANWQESYASLHPKMAELEVIKNGTTSLEQGEKWLECVCKVHPYPIANMTINQTSGLGAKEIRALVAHDNHEYHPTLSANEIYQSKQLQAFPIEFNTNSDEPFILNAAREILIEDNGIGRERDRELAMLEGGATWLRSRPSFCGSQSGQSVIIDIQLNKYASDKSIDEIRLHYHELVSASLDMQPSQLYQASLNIDHSIKEQLSNLASISKASENHAKELLKEMIRTGAHNVQFNLEVVQPNANIFNDICKTGQEHWGDILQGKEINYQQDKQKISLPEEVKSEYKEMSKELVVARKMFDYMKARQADMGKQIQNFVVEKGIGKATDTEYQATYVGEKKTYNLEMIASLITSRSEVQDKDLRKAKINQDTLFELLSQRGPDGHLSHSEIMNAVEYGDYDKEMVLMMAPSADIDIKTFEEHEVKVYVSGQSRSEVANVMGNIQAEIEKQAEQTLAELKDSATLDNNNLSEKIANSGMSYHMEF